MISKQEKQNAIQRLDKLFNIINNEMTSSFKYLGSMKKGRRDSIKINSRQKFDIDADIMLNLKVVEDPEVVFEDIKRMIKNGLRKNESAELKVSRQNRIIIKIQNENTSYEFDLCIKDHEFGSICFDGTDFYWENRQ